MDVNPGKACCNCVPPCLMSSNFILPTEHIYGRHVILKINCDISLNVINQCIVAMDTFCISLIFDGGEEGVRTELLINI